MMIEDFQKESWVALYRTAMLELERAKMSGRITAARTEIVARVEKLHTMPGLHPEERQAIEDALSGLRVLVEEEQRYSAEQKRHILDRSLQALKSVAPAILKTDEDLG
jgi:Skp family chaperone for outer membrane proteins